MLSKREIASSIRPAWTYERRVRATEALLDLDGDFGLRSVDGEGVPCLRC